jgi:hypothetical protein
MTLTRRTFLSRGSIGVAIAGGLSVVPILSTILKAQPKRTVVDMGSMSTDPLVAHVRDMTRGEMSLMVGADKVVVHDIDLASRLYAAARRR